MTQQVYRTALGAHAQTAGFASTANAIDTPPAQPRGDHSYRDGHHHRQTMAQRPRTQLSPWRQTVVSPTPCLPTPVLTGGSEVLDCEISVPRDGFRGPRRYKGGSAGTTEAESSPIYKAAPLQSAGRHCPLPMRRAPRSGPYAGQSLPTPLPTARLYRPEACNGCTTSRRRTCWWTTFFLPPSVTHRVCSSVTGRPAPPPHGTADAGENLGRMNNAGERVERMGCITQDEPERR